MQERSRDIITQAFRGTKGIRIRERAYLRKTNHSLAAKFRREQSPIAIPLAR